MGFFDTTNSMEQLSSEKQSEKATEVPIREATGAEVAGATLRRAREVNQALAAQFVKDDKVSFFRRKEEKPAELDDVAKRNGYYVTDRNSTRTYYQDYQQKQEVMRAEPTRVTSRLDDKQTIGAMLDVAQSKGWEGVKLRGTEDFRREAWVQSQVRGLRTEGYKATETDQQEVKIRKGETASGDKDTGSVDMPAVKMEQDVHAVEKTGAKAEAAAKQNVVEKARQLWDAGMSATEIGKEIGLNKNQVIGLAHRNDFTPRESPIKRDGAGATEASGSEKTDRITAPEPVAEGHTRFYARNEDKSTLTTNPREAASAATIHYVDVPKDALGGLSPKAGSSTEFRVDDPAIASGLKLMARKQEGAATAQTQADVWKVEQARDGNGGSETEGKLRLYYAHTPGKANISEDGAVTFTTDRDAAEKQDKAFYVDIEKTEASLSRFKADGDKFVTKDMDVFAAVKPLESKATEIDTWKSKEEQGASLCAKDAGERPSANQGERRKLAEAAD